MQLFKKYIPVNLPLYLFMLMMAGLLLSRALLSVSTALWLVVIVAFISSQQFKLYRHLLLWSLFPLLLFTAGAYQQIDAKDNYDYLLTLMIYPIAAFASVALVPFNDKIKKAWIIFAFASLIYPLSLYTLNFAEINILYGKGQSLPTLMNGDHVRYGIFLNATLLFVLSIKNIKTSVRLLLLFIIVLVIILMAVRTSWVSLIICTLFLLFRQQHLLRFNRWFLLLIIPVFIASYFIFPAVSQKINYTIYDWKTYDTATYNPDYSDGARRTVNNVAWSAIKNGNSNVGWAAVPSTLNQSFKKYFPSQQLNYGWPFNQWLYWLLGSGWVGFIFFSAWLLYPIFYAIKNKGFLLIIWTAIICASCVVESTLNLQFGVFLHAWPIALFWVDTININSSNAQKSMLTNEN